jgi:hypothetical protein
MVNGSLAFFLAHGQWTTHFNQRAHVGGRRSTSSQCKQEQPLHDGLTGSFVPRRDCYPLMDCIGRSWSLLPKPILEPHHTDKPQRLWCCIRWRWCNRHSTHRRVSDRYRSSNRRTGRDRAMLRAKQQTAPNTSGSQQRATSTGSSTPSWSS